MSYRAILLDANTTIAMKTAEISSTSIFPGIIDLMKVLNIKNVRLLLCALVAFIILRIPSLYEPHWYADEGIYAAITWGMENGKTLYTQLWDNKPPLIYYLYGLGDSHNRLIVIRALNLTAGLVTLVGLWKLIELLDISKKARNIGIIFATLILGTPILEGNIANAENFFVPLIIFGYILLLLKRPIYIVSGIFFGTAFLFKFHPFFDFAAAGLYLLITQKSLKKTVLFIIGFCIPLVLQSAILFLQGNLSAGISIIFFNNFNYTQSYSQGIKSVEFRSLILIIGLTLSSCLFYAKKISHQIYFLCLVVLFEVYAGLFGGRRYVHYLIQVIPAAVLVSGFFVERTLEEKETKKKFAYPVVLVLVFWILLRVFMLGEGQAMRYDIPKYYAEFFSYVTKEKPYFISDIDARFEHLNKELQQYDKSDLYIYSNNAWLYDVLEIYPPIPVIVGYHRTFVGEDNFIEMLINAKPKTIVFDTFADPSDPLSQLLNDQYSFDRSIDEYQIWLIK